jgi:hypothetical protein
MMTPECFVVIVSMSVFIMKKIVSQDMRALASGIYSSFNTILCIMSFFRDKVSK